ncbi:serine hydrolase [Paenibacillus sp. OV219]|uniref:serine hydrolase domain-containing protein n=1 Tax=Paenibacillus sp. OV219 TaxID=1884377 RepID=UPI0008C2D68B|nr:serine hydrolase domain-containing protein [Paenibacillus sp. OV219]SEM50957.1 CubicO group peptidase, beta-lactamase class C family [Paenibacillus sp. OV219]
MNFTPLSRFIDRITSWRIPWAEVLVMHRNEIVFRYRAGFVDLEAKTPIDEDRIIYLYSLTKILTCTAALQLVEKGAILLGDPISAYLPEFTEVVVGKKQMEDGVTTKLSERPITVRDLFTMTAGFSYDLTSPSIREAVERTNGRVPTREFARALAKEPLLFEPGTRWNYSLCHDVLAALVEEVGGRRFSTYVREEITGPLGMLDTGFHLSEAQLSRLAPQYEFNDALGKAVRMDGNWYRIGMEFDSGGAGLLSTVSDYSLFLNTLTNRGTSPDGVRILSPASVDLMRTDHLTEHTRSDYNWEHHAGYGYGLGVRTHISKAGSGSISPLGEFGWSGAAGSFAIIDPESQLTVMYAQHLVNNQEPYVHPRLKNIVYSCLS